MNTADARFRVRLHWLRWCRGGLVIVFALISVPPLTADRQETYTQPLPAGFTLLRDRQWDPGDRPWVFSGSTSGDTALPMLNSYAPPPARPMTVRLDDGSQGTLHAEARDCGPNDDCSPYDCGCTGANESNWIEIRRPNGAVIARQHLWAAYRRFQIVPVDLVDGPGDELLVARIPGHASPPIGWDLKVWRIGKGIADLGGMSHLESSVYSVPFGCARWMARLTIDPGASKPRPISLAVDLASPAGCQVDAEQLVRIVDLKRPHALQFDAKSGRYALTGPAPNAFR